MLYVKRYCTGNSFIIVDTDDNTEEIVGRAELSRIYETCNIDIKGVDVTRFADGSVSLYIRPYNISSSKKTAKLAVLTGLDLIVDEDGCLCRITCTRDYKGGTLHLKDYCTSIAPYAFSALLLPSNVELVLVFDDSIKLLARALQNVRTVGRLFRADITNCANKKLVKSVYSYFPVTNVIDNEYRLQFHQVLDMLSSSRSISWYSSKKLPSLLSNTEFRKDLENYLRPIFRGMSLTVFDKDTVKGVGGNLGLGNLHILNKRAIPKVMWHIGYYTILDNKSCNMMAKYLYLIDSSEEFRQYYATLATNYLRYREEVLNAHSIKGRR